MIPTPFRLVVLASLPLLVLPGCTNEPVKSIPAAGVTAYDHAGRSQLRKTGYIQHHKQIQINAQNTATTQRARPANIVTGTQVVKNPQQTVFAVKARYSGNKRGTNLRQTWKDVHQGFQLGNYNHKSRVKRYIRSYARMPGRMVELNHRSSKYLPAIIAEVKRRGMPTEIALLPFVESAFNNEAYSPAKAAGLWQFIPATARRYGLPVSSRYDARYNWKASTRAALDYLQDLNRRFKGDWLLSLAAYNCGEGRVEREIARNRARGLPTDFWSLRLPRETRHYVPRLLAFKEIYGNPAAHGIHIAHIPANPDMMRNRYLSTLKMNTGSQAGSRKKVAKYVKKRNKKSRKPNQSKKRIVTHKVRSGETLFRIAKRYRTSVHKIMHMNGLKSTKIRAGKRLRIATYKRRYYG